MSRVIEAEGLEVRYGERTVVALEHFAVELGHTLALLGPNGAGKSTLLRVLALLERPTKGLLTLLGERVGRDEGRRLRLRRRMATVFQAPLLLDRSLYDNVALGLRLRGLGDRVVRPRVERWLERLGLGPLARRPARTLSGGEAQRASLARALVLDPEILFLDEPFAALDRDGREALALELEPILREAGITTICVTHDRQEAMLLAEEAVVMLGGRVRQRDRTAQVFARPADAAVARFLGVENLIPARVVHCDGRPRVELGGQAIPLRLPANPPAHLWLCLRAEDVHLAPPEGAAEPGSVRIPARVERVVPAGVPYRVELDAGFPLVALAARRNVERLALARGAEVLASFDPGAIHPVPAPEPGSPLRR
jgi:tungstate transport system ATP-binding protein